MNPFEQVQGFTQVGLEAESEWDDTRIDDHAGELTVTSDTIQHFPAIIEGRKFTILIIEHTS